MKTLLKLLSTEPVALVAHNIPLSQTVAPRCATSGRVAEQGSTFRGEFESSPQPRRRRGSPEKCGFRKRNDGDRAPPTELGAFNRAFGKHGSRRSGTGARSGKPIGFSRPPDDLARRASFVPFSGELAAKLDLGLVDRPSVRANELIAGEGTLSHDFVPRGTCRKLGRARQPSVRRGSRLLFAGRVSCRLRLRLTYASARRHSEVFLWSRPTACQGRLGGG